MSFNKFQEVSRSFKKVSRKFQEVSRSFKKFQEVSSFKKFLEVSRSFKKFQDGSAVLRGGQLHFNEANGFTKFQ
jgi:hypothetical protein